MEIFHGSGLQLDPEGKGPDHFVVLESTQG